MRDSSRLKINMADKVKHVVVDANAFIGNAPIKDIGVNIYTVQEVVSEIRSKAVRDRLQVLPYELQFREPSAEVLKIVSDFAKKTGDYRSLSAVDLKLVGLVYHLEKENSGTEHLKSKPDSKITWATTSKTLEKPTDIAGFYLKKTNEGKSRTSSENHDNALDRTADGVREIQIEDSESNGGSKGTENIKNEESEHTSAVQGDSEAVIDTKELPDESVMGLRDNQVKDGDTLPSKLLQDEHASDSEEDASSDDDDEDGWITPGNIASIKESLGEPVMERASVPVACLTTDFAMQNVLIQMGLNVISVDGMLIKRAKSFVFRCHACFKITTNMTKEFCPHCGNRTLQKVSMTVNDDGTIQYFLSRKKAVSRRGLKYSLPAPKGGKHAKNPILCEDQKEAQQRCSKAAKLKYNAMDPDYILHNSPFAPNDIYSRAAQLGIRGNANKRRNRNPNESRKHGRRK